MLNKIKHTAKKGTSKFIKAIAVVGTTLFITLNVNANPASADVQKEIKDVLKKNPGKEIIVKANEKQEENAAKFETLGGNDTLKDPYDQIREYVSPTDTAYFNQLRTHMETKDSTEQIKCKAVVYAILQDTALNQEQRQTLALAYFERLAKMPGSNYRFRLAGNEKYKEDKTYADRRNRYSGYKSYLDVLALDEEITKLKEKSKQLDEKSKQLDEEIKNLRRQNQLLEQLLKAYQQK